MGGRARAGGRRSGTSTTRRPTSRWPSCRGRASSSTPTRCRRASTRCSATPSRTRCPTGARSASPTRSSSSTTRRAARRACRRTATARCSRSTSRSTTAASTRAAARGSSRWARRCRSSRGHVCAHASGVLHFASHPITSGVRYILVGFVLLEDYQNWAMRFMKSVWDFSPFSAPAWKVLENGESRSGLEHGVSRVARARHGGAEGFFLRLANLPHVLPSSPTHILVLRFGRTIRLCELLRLRPPSFSYRPSPLRRTAPARSVMRPRRVVRVSSNCAGATCAVVDAVEDADGPFVLRRHP